MRVDTRTALIDLVREIATEPFMADPRTTDRARSLINLIDAQPGYDARGHYTAAVDALDDFDRATEVLERIPIAISEEDPRLIRDEGIVDLMKRAAAAESARINTARAALHGLLFIGVTLCDAAQPTGLVALKSERDHEDPSTRALRQLTAVLDRIAPNVTGPIIKRTGGEPT